MAAAASHKRDTAAAKLGDSIRQLRRYLDQADQTERILSLKSNKVDVDREELLARHHSYAEKAGIALTDDDMKAFIEEKIDNAVDIVDEATLMLEDLGAAAIADKKKTELSVLKLQVLSGEKLITDIITKIDGILVTESTTKNAHLAQSYVDVLGEKTAELTKIYIELKSKIDDEEEIQPHIQNEQEMLTKVTQKRVEAKSFMAEIRSSDDTSSTLSSANSGSSTRSSTSNSNIRMTKMKPPKFSGDIRDFASFKEDFEKMVQKSYEDAVHQIYIMKQECLQGDALDLVRNLNSLEDIWERLTEKYGDTIEIVDSVIRDLRNITIPKMNQDQGLIKLIETLEKGIQDLTAIGKRDKIANAYTVKLMEDKLPRRVLSKWFDATQRAEQNLSIPSTVEDAVRPVAPLDRFERFLLFLKNERKLTEKLVQQTKEKDRSIDEDRRNKGVVKGKLNMNLKGNTKGNKCLIHPTQPHLTRRCSDYQKMSVNERAKLVKDQSACKLCLSVSHVGSTCPWESKWQPCDVDGCNEYHSRTLHGNTVLVGMHLIAAAKTEIEEADKNRILLLMQEISDGYDKVFTFWDNGSMISLVSRQYAKKRNLKGINVSYDLTTVNSVTTPQHTKMFNVPIVDINGKVTNIKAYEIESICDDVAFFDENITKIFEDLKITDVARPKANIDLLIGADYINIHPTKMKCNGKLALFKSLFGTGRVLAGSHKSLSYKGKDQMNAFAKIVAFGAARNFGVEHPSSFIDFFTAENLGVTLPPRCNRCKKCRDCSFEAHQLSQIEQKELDVIRSNLKLDPTQDKWVTKYPYKMDPGVLQNNEEQADALLFRLEKRLLRNKVARDSFCEQFDDAVKRGVYKEIPQEELDSYDGPIRYVTQHAVEKDGSASTPIRIVSNSSLKYKGLSLNDILMKGPNSLSDLFSVHLNFRTYLVAAVGDVKKMYHSVSTTVVERHLRRVKWRSMDLNVSPKIYGTETVQFGDVPATAITTTAINDTSDVYEYIDPVAADKIKNDSYVDDFATGDETKEATINLVNNITTILDKGGFHIKGWVLSGDSSEECLALLGTGNVGRVLGVGWSPPTDEFSVVVKIMIPKTNVDSKECEEITKEKIPSLITEKLTRRVLLGVTNSIYDLYGFFVPITISMKILIRETYKKDLKLSWDDDIPKELKAEWITLLKLLKEAESLRFRRSISHSNSVGDPELVVFNDGSTQAMCAAVYIRWFLETGEYACQLIAAKAKVAPLVRSSIPRIEMDSAVLGIRLTEKIRGSCRLLNFKKTTYISDSKCTIATIAKDSSALKEYMGNRVSEIRRHSDPSQWYHARSADNIADLGTRMGATVEDLSEDSEWQLGPRWLRLERSEWPVTQDIESTHVPEEELCKSKLCSFTAVATPIIDLNRMRSYDFTMRVTARIFNIFKNKSFKNNVIDPDGLDKAENYWIKESMKLTSEKFEKGHLDSLRPKKDENGLIVLSTRALKGMKQNYNQDVFPILSNNDPLARLWVRKVHFEDHSGVNKTAAKCRRKFWIVRVNRLARTVKNSCYVCKLLDKMLAMQQMAPLTDNRLTPAPVFNTTSLDLFGPFTVKDTVKKRTEMKIWGMIFTCAATRAIHIDITDSYSTDSILQTLRKFTALRGCPEEIISDQGSQLVAASRDESNLTKDWDWSSISDWAGSNKIKWTLVPAEAQHQNGLSESLIKSIKRSIAHTIGKTVLSFSEFQLAMFEIANIINSRPIGIISGSDPDDPKPITPNDLILGRSTNEVPQGPFNSKVSITRRFLFVQSLVDDWWQQWYNIVLPSLVPSYKWKQKYRNVKVGDICLIRYKGIRSTYRLGRVTETKLGKDGLVRSVRLTYKLSTEKSFRFVDRAIQGIAVIVPIEEQG